MREIAILATNWNKLQGDGAGTRTLNLAGERRGGSKIWGYVAQLREANRRKRGGMRGGEGVSFEKEDSNERVDLWASETE